MEPITIFTFFLADKEVAEVLIPQHVVPSFLKAYHCGEFEESLAKHDTYDVMQAS